MNFPLYFDFFGLRLHPHPTIEASAYFAAARLYFILRRRDTSRPPLSLEKTLWLLIAAAFGAILGSKLLAYAESPAHYRLLHPELRSALGGKTIVGGLLGGWLGLELAKKLLRIRHSTGDTFYLPIALGTAIGRLACFFTGLADRTYGTASSLPWAIDFGDGITRHPTQLYESAFVLLLAASIFFATRRSALTPGIRFRLYMLGYLLFRFAIEFIKPRELLLGPLSAIQLTCLAAVALIAAHLRLLLKTQSPPKTID